MIGVQQSGKAVHVDAAVAIAVKPRDAEIPPSSLAVKRWVSGMATPSCARHQAVGVLGRAGRRVILRRTGT